MMKKPSVDQMLLMLEHAGLTPGLLKSSIKKMFKTVFGNINRKEANQYIKKTIKIDSNMRPTINQIIDEAKSLMTESGTVTTLEVKNRLRQQGYWVSQTDVSTAIKDGYASLGWTWSMQGDYRLYTIDSLQTTNGTAQAQTAPIQAPKSRGRKPSVFINFTDVSDMSKNDLVDWDQQTWITWNAHSKTGKVFAFDKFETRDHVRTVYARETGIPMKDVRARRLAHTAFAAK